MVSPTNTTSNHLGTQPSKNRSKYFCLERNAREMLIAKSVRQQNILIKIRPSDDALTA